MVNLRRKLQTPAETNASPEQAQEQAPGEGGNSTSVVERASAYSAMENELVPAEDTVGVLAEPAGEEPNPEAEVANLAVVGEEVGAVLQSAQEAAVRIRRTGQQEGERLQAEAESAAAAKLEEARGIASAELAGGQQVRAEAEAYAREARAAADVFAEERRREAERAAAQMVSDAQKLLAAADAEVAQKIREAEAKAHERHQGLEAEVERYEMRLESMLGVFRGMSSQLEDLVGRRQAESGTAPEVSHDALEDALRPDRSS